MLSALVLLMLVEPPTQAQMPPNIVIVLADDLGWGDPGCYNPESKIPTPHIDRLASQGLRLTDCHSPSAVCTPTRYGILTGRYAWRTHLKQWVLGGYSELLPDPNRSTIASELQKAGYHTGVVGKWHLGLGSTDPANFNKSLRPGPLELGFDECFLIPASLDMPPYCYVDQDQPVVAPTALMPESRHRRNGGGGMWRAGAASPGFDFRQVLPTLQDRAVEFIEEAAAHGTPFLLYFPMTSPHTPWVPTESFVGVTGIDHYGDFVAQTDSTLGAVMEALDRTGAADNTLVIFTSDNGAHWPIDDIEKHGHRANGPWRGQKADIHEGGHRVPCVVRWPGQIAPATQSDALTCLTDLYDTCIEACGATGSLGGPDGVSQLAVWTGGATADRGSIVHHSGDGMFAIRRGDWKLIEAQGSGGFTNPKRPVAAVGQAQGQLYNLADDPSETTSVWSSHRQVVAAMQAELDAIRTQESGQSTP